jgi:hypothetical protein
VVCGLGPCFHTLALSVVDLEFAKQQLEIVLSGRYIHPSGQVPAYESNFSGVNPPVHARATLFLYRMLSWVQPARTAVTEEEARTIAVEAYVYLYPLVTMDVTRRQFTNLEPGKEIGKSPMNMFVNVSEYPPANFKGVVRPNFDTLYSIAWLDLTKEPLVVSVPDTDGCYYLLLMLDMWTDVFASPGWRTTGTTAQDFVIVAPGSRPYAKRKLPKDTERIDAPTPYAWITGRTNTDGPQDHEAVHKIQAGLMITPLSRWGKKPEPINREDRSSCRYEDPSKGTS